MSDTYDKLRPYWEAWKSDDPADSSLRNDFIEICKAIAGVGSGKVPAEALEAALELRRESLMYLKSLANFDASANTLTLYRGITDDGANRLRRALEGEGTYEDQPGTPISYSTERGAALGFARKGKYYGALYQQAVSLDSMVFVDRGYYKDGNLHDEAEVLVLRLGAIAMLSTDVLNAKIEPQKPGFRSKADKQKWQQERARLEKEDSQGF